MRDYSPQVSTQKKQEGPIFNSCSIPLVLTVILLHSMLFYLASGSNKKQVGKMFTFEVVVYTYTYIHGISQVA